MLTFTSHYNLGYIYNSNTDNERRNRRIISNWKRWYLVNFTSNKLTSFLFTLEFYKQFLDPSEKRKLDTSLSIVEQVKKLGDGIELLSRELQKQVLENHDDLLRQASHATRLENVLETMNMHVQNLFANAERLKAQVGFIGIEKGFSNRNFVTDTRTVHYSGKSHQNFG